METGNKGLSVFRTERNASHGTRRALLVCDKNSDFKTLASMLKQFAFDVAESENILDGVRRFHDGETYDIVFMNRYMTVMNGLQATSLLRKKGIITKIVGISFDDACEEEFLEAGADAFCIMPMGRPDLAKVVEAIGLIH